MGCQKPSMPCLDLLYSLRYHRVLEWQDYWQATLSMSFPKYLDFAARKNPKTSKYCNFEKGIFSLTETCLKLKHRTVSEKNKTSRPTQPISGIRPTTSLSQQTWKVLPPSKPMDLKNPEAPAASLEDSKPSKPIISNDPILRASAAEALIQQLEYDLFTEVGAKTSIETTLASQSQTLESTASEDSKSEPLELESEPSAQSPISVHSVHSVHSNTGSNHSSLESSIETPSQTSQPTHSQKVEEEPGAPQVLKESESFFDFKECTYLSSRLSPTD